MKVYLDTSPLQSDHAIRGIGMYTKLLQQALKEHKNVTLMTEEELPQAADIIHYPYFDLFFDTLPLRQQAPTVVTIHDVIPLEFPEYYKPGVKGSLRFHKQKLALRWVSAIITDSQYSKQKIHELVGIPLHKIHVVYLASNPGLQPPTSTQVREARKEHQLPTQYVLYVGDINYNKNIPQLIKMVKFLPEDIHLVCVGKNFYPHEILEWQWIEAQLEMSQVRDRVHFITNLPAGADVALAALYAEALCYVQPSLSEGFGLPVLEALNCGTLVVSSNRGSLPEVGGEVPFYVEPTAEDMAAAIEKVLTLSTRARHELIAHGQDWVKKFSWQKVAHQTVAVYTEVLAKK